MREGRDSRRITELVDGVMSAEQTRSIIGQGTGRRKSALGLQKRDTEQRRCRRDAER